MSRIFALVSYLAVGLLVSTAGEARGQGSSGMFGSQARGTSFTPSASNFNGSAAARGGAAGGAAGLGALGAMGAGGSLAGATQRGDATAGQVSGSERFLRGNRQPGQFVGGDAADANAFFSQLTGMGGAGLGARGQNNAQRNQNNVRLVPSKARVQIVPGFSYAVAGGDRVSTTLQTRLEKSPRIERRGPITVHLEGRTAVLSGSVATEHDRELAERVALLEVGVAAVRNELTVAPLPAATDLPTTTLPNSTPTAPTSN